MKKNTSIMSNETRKWLFLFILFFSFYSNNLFSQTQNRIDENKVIVEKIVSVDGEDAIFSQLIDNTLKEVDVKSQSIYRSRLEVTAKKIKDEAIEYLARNYSKSDLESIYKEALNYNRLTRSATFDDFFKNWIVYKQKFYKSFKKIHKAYKK